MNPQKVHPLPVIPHTLASAAPAPNSDGSTNDCEGHLLKKSLTALTSVEDPRHKASVSSYRCSTT